MRHSLALILLLTLTACGIFSPDIKKEPSPATQAKELFDEAKEQMMGGYYEQAIKNFETLQSRFPYGRYAQQAQLEIAYAYYKQQEPESAIAAADRFIKLYPNHKHVDYAYYLKGLANFNENMGLLGGIVKQDLSERDPYAAREAFATFKELVTRFPDSRYTPDARLRLQYLVNALARYEVHVAQYYLRRGAHIAAANRAKDILRDYPQTLASMDALRIMVSAYDAMGMNELRDDTQRVLDKNLANAEAAKQKVTGLTEAQGKKSWWQFWK
ncbi:MAG: outer membrane protein assembly factor BamD [Gallionellaceae bacterium]|nr:outer membrane protein assembly factor BamD [Gallionellaceae bacterium]